jgi:predicted phosphodiesterase
VRIFITTLALLGMAAGAVAQGTIEADVQTEAKPWTSLELNNSPEVFRFAVVSDNSGGPRAGIFSEAIAKLNLLQPEFVMSTGDFVEGYEETREQIDAQIDKFMAEIAKLEVPFFFVPGNHDVGRPVWSEAYNARHGVSYYHFVYKNVLFLCLSTNDGPEKETGIGPEQVEYAKKVIAEHADVRWTLVFQHKPLWNDDNAEWKQIAESLKGRNVTFFAGHTHNYLSQSEHGISFITQATTGGGSPLRGPAYGEFDGIAWVTMTEEGPRVANLLLDGILDRDIRTPETAKANAIFSMDRAVTATPIALEAGPFKEGTSKLTITNPSEQPLRVKVLSESPAGVRVEPSTVAVVVPAKSEHTAELKISADAPVPVPQMQPVVLHWEAFYDHGNNTPSTEFGGERRITIDEPYAIPAATGATQVDGKLDDWPELPFEVMQPAQVWHNPPAWKGPQDGSYRFGVKSDEQYLYVAVKATDNESCFDGWKYWEDFATVFVDGRGSDDQDPKESVFNLFAGPQMDMAQGEEFGEGTAPEGVKMASQPTEDGFAAEFAIPVSYLNALQNGNWERCRLNVAFGDFDRNEARDGVSLLYWRPEWSRRSDVPAAVFVKAAKP